MANIQLGFYFDQTRCMACNACSVACKDWNQINPGLVNWRSQFTHEMSTGFYPFSMSCNHCEAPACMSVCSYGAISKSEEGVVTVDRNKCQNLRACVSACPFAVPKFADAKQEPNAILGWQIQHPMQKCTMCADRLDKGDKPACVKACVARALDFGSMDMLKNKYPSAVQLNEVDFPYMYHIKGAANTGPSMLVKKRPANSVRIRKSAVYTGK